MKKYYQHKVEETICKNCGKTFYRMKKRTKGRRAPPGVRSLNCNTCSPNCSKEYMNKMTKIYDETYRKAKISS